LQTVELSTFRFLFDTDAHQRRRLRFLDVLLAALRVAILLVLVVIVCRPGIRPWRLLFGGEGAKDVALLVDCSASMNARSAGISALDRAKSVACRIVGALQPTDRVTVVRVTSRPEEVGGRLPADAQGLSQQIEGLQLSPGRGNVFAAISHVFSAARPAPVAQLVYLLTDCQADGWQEVSQQSLRGILPADTPVVVIDVGSRHAVPNLAAVGDPPTDGVIVAGSPTTLHARVAYFGTGVPAAAALGLFVDDKEVTRTSIAIQPGQTAARDFVYLPTEPGLHRCRFEILGHFADGFPDDNLFRFILSVVPPPRVLIVDGDPTAEPYDREAVYVRSALAAHPGSDPAGSSNNRSLPRVREVAESEVRPDVLRETDVVVLANCGGLRFDQFARLRDFVAHGGGLLILPGDRVDPRVYNDQFFAGPRPSTERLTPAAVGSWRGDPGQPEKFERLADFDASHPSMAPFRDPEARFLKSARYYRWFPLVVPERRDNAWRLAEFSDHTPALVESRFGDGLVMLAAFPANTRWSNLPLKPEFVPLILRLVSRLLPPPALQVPPVVEADGSATFTTATNWAPVSATVTDPGGRSRPMTFERAGPRFAADIDRCEQRGYYTVEVYGGDAARRETRTTSYAVNVAARESDFARLDQNRLRELMPGPRLAYVDASADAIQLNGDVGSEREVWRPLLALLVALFVVEFMLATAGDLSRSAKFTSPKRI
jgi:hypothetical protein